MFILLVFKGKLTSALRMNHVSNLWHQAKWKKLKKATKGIDDVYLSLDDYSASFEWYRGVAEFSLGEHKKALTSFNKAQLKHPNHLPTLNNSASTYQTIGKPDSAIKYYLKTLKISPYYDESRLNLAATYFNLGNTTEAVKHIKKTRKDSLHPNFPYFSSAIIKSHLETFEELEKYDVKNHPNRFYIEMLQDTAVVNLREAFLNTLN